MGAPASFLIVSRHIRVLRSTVRCRECAWAAGGGRNYLRAGREHTGATGHVTVAVQAVETVYRRRSAA